MNLDDLLAFIAGILVVILLILINFKIFTTNRKILTKIVFLILTLLFSLPFWYLIQFIVTFTLAYTIPQNKIANCIYLNEESCKKRPDCSVGYVDNIGGGAFCINKPKYSK